MRRSLEIAEAAFGDQHPNVAVSLNNLAQILMDADRIAEVELLMRRSLDILDSFARQTEHELPQFQLVKANYQALRQTLEPDEPGQSVKPDRVLAPVSSQVVLGRAAVGRVSLGRNPKTNRSIARVLAMRWKDSTSSGVEGIGCCSLSGTKLVASEGRTWRSVQTNVFRAASSAKPVRPRDWIPPCSWIPRPEPPDRVARMCQ